LSLFQTKEQAQRVAWRILKDWIQTQMAIIEAGLSSTVEVFMPYAVMDSGQTLFQSFSENPRFLLSLIWTKIWFSELFSGAR